MPELADTVHRILTIDDNDAIHGDFRKILVQSVAPSKLSGKKALLFGSDSAKPSAETSTPRGRFELESALQGQEGLQHLKTAIAEGRPFSVAFVDMRMPPGWDGLQTIQMLWEVDPELQVVICTAYSDYSWEEISAKLGLTDRLLILKKPFDPAEVTQLAIALSEKRALRTAAKLKMDQLEQMVSDRTVELTKLALQDKLTGLANRTLFNERLATAVRKASTSPDYAFAVLFLDFDRFKLINDSMGHDAGDKVLKGIAERLTAALQLAGPRVGDATAARLGGDEFTILIDGAANTLDHNAFADTLLRLLAAPYSIDGHEMHCTASIGVTSSNLSYRSAEDALRDADTAMYHAKAAGKARYAFFDRKMHEAVASRMEMENDLRHALERDEISAHFQSVVSLPTGELQGFEALARWTHPTREAVAPLDFIPCCEEIGLIVPVGLRILTLACQQLRRWTSDPKWAHLTMSVNLSVHQLRSPSLIKDIDRILRETGINPRSLVLEITESAMIGDADAAIIVMKQISELGVRLHLDDFGVGYSSLSCLHLFPLNGLKIDRSFVKHVNERKDYRAVVEAIIRLARNLDITLVAEGLETAEQVELLTSMGCNLAQGYFFHRPADVASVEANVLKLAPALARAA